MLHQKWMIVIIGLFAVAASPGHASGEFLQFGDCRLQVDPANSIYMDDSSLFSTCIKGGVSVDATYAINKSEEKFWGYYGLVYGGIHISPELSLHAQGRFREITSLENDSVHRYLDSDYALLRLGNPVLHRFRLALGKVILPFGVDKNSASGFYKSFENRIFWDSPQKGAILTFDNHFATWIEVGFGTDELLRSKHTSEKEGALPDEKVKSRKAWSFRLAHDMPALEGSRILLSGYGDTANIRRLGLGFVAVNPRGDVSQFELIQRFAPQKEGKKDLQRLVRLGHTSAFHEDSRWVFQYDDELHRQRLGLIGYDQRYYGHLIARFALAYSRWLEGRELRRLYLTTGLEVNL